MALGNVQLPPQYCTECGTGFVSRFHIDVATEDVVCGKCALGRVENGDGNTVAPLQDIDRLSGDTASVLDEDTAARILVALGGTAVMTR